MTKVTGWDTGLCQDYDRGLGRWFADRLGARHQLRKEFEMKYYAVTGRIPGDDEDTVLCVGQHPDKGSAIDSFTAELLELGCIDEEHTENLRQEYGTSVFINSIVSSDSRIEDAS